MSVRLLFCCVSILFAASSSVLATPLVALQIQDDAGTISMGENFDVNITRTVTGGVSINTDVSIVGGLTSSGTISGVSATLSGAVLASNVYGGSNLLQIPSQYATLALALAVIQNRVLAYVVTIQFADGSYSQANTHFAAIASPHMIRIIGNTANVTAVSLTQAASGLMFHLFSVGGSGITMGWLKLIGFSTVDGSTGLSALNAKLSLEGPIVLSNFQTAVSVTQGGWAIVRQVNATGCANGLVVSSGYADAIGIALSGLGAQGTGVSISGGSTVTIASATISSFAVGVSCSGGAKEVITTGINLSSISGTALSCPVAIPDTMYSVTGYQFRHRVIAAKYQNTGTTTLTSGTATGMDFPTKVWDTQSPNMGNGFSQFTIPVTGYYSFSAMGCIAGGPTGDRILYFVRNFASQFGYVSTNGAGAVCLRTTDVVTLVAGDVIYLAFLQTTGSPVGTFVSGSGISAMVSIHYIGE